MIKSAWTYIAISIAVIVLAACGSGGGSSNSNNNGGGSTNTVPTVDAGVDQSVISGDVVTLSATVTDDDTPTVSWSQVSGTAATLSSTNTSDTEFTAPAVTGSDTLEFEISVDDGTNAAVTDTVVITVLETAPSLPDAFLWFNSDDVTVTLDGSEVVIESTARPDHTTPYWDPNGTSGLWIEADPNITDVDQMSPGFIDRFDNMYTLRVPINPVKANTSTATTLGAVGISVNGVPIFNDQEGPNVDLDLGVISGFDRAGGHTGPETYHYHLEPRPISNDDSELVGVIADGFLIYGRRDFVDGNYPTDLDISGGHVGFTQHTGTEDGDEVYHYHIKNEFYLGEYYLLFPEDYQGTPNNISR